MPRTHARHAGAAPPATDRVKLLLGANGVFEVFVDVDRQRADRMHGYTSSETSQALGAWTTVGGAGAVPELGGNDQRPARMLARPGPGSVDRGQEAAGGAIESEPSILPGGALTQSRESLHVAPDGTGIRLVLFRECVRLRSVLLRHIMSLHD